MVLSNHALDRSMTVLGERSARPTRRADPYLSAILSEYFLILDSQPCAYATEFPNYLVLNLRGH
jgi:hypothetical protein